MELLDLFLSQKKCFFILLLIFLSFEQLPAAIIENITFLATAFFINHNRDSKDKQETREIILLYLMFITEIHFKIKQKRTSPMEKNE